MDLALYYNYILSLGERLAERYTVLYVLLYISCESIIISKRKGFKIYILKEGQNFKRKTGKEWKTLPVGKRENVIHITQITTSPDNLQSSFQRTVEYKVEKIIGARLQSILNGKEFRIYPCIRGVLLEIFLMHGKNQNRTSERLTRQQYKEQTGEKSIKVERPATIAIAQTC